MENSPPLSPAMFALPQQMRKFSLTKRITTYRINGGMPALPPGIQKQIGGDPRLQAIFKNIKDAGNNKRRSRRSWMPLLDENSPNLDIPSISSIDSTSDDETLEDSASIRSVPPPRSFIRSNIMDSPYLSPISPHLRTAKKRRSMMSVFDHSDVEHRRAEINETHSLIANSFHDGKVAGAVELAEEDDCDELPEEDAYDELPEDEVSNKAESDSEEESVNPMVVGYEDDLDPEDVAERSVPFELTHEITVEPERKNSSDVEERDILEESSRRSVPLNFLDKDGLNALENVYEPSMASDTPPASAPNCSSHSADASDSEIGSEAGSTKAKEREKNSSKLKTKDNPKEKKGKQKKSRKDANDDDDLPDVDVSNGEEEGSPLAEEAAAEDHVLDLDSGALVTPAVRRSQRTRVKPLNYWMNERPIYRRDSTGLAFKMIGVQEGSNASVKVTKRKPSKRGHRSKGASSDKPLLRSNLMDLSIHASNYDNVVLENDKRLKLMARSGFTLSDMRELNWKPSGVSEGVMMAIQKKRSGHAQGVLMLKPLAKKARQKTAEYETSFVISYGCVSLQVEDQPVVILKTFATFELGPGTLYSMHNLRNDTAYVSFTVTKA